jgi:hypothetical protein
MRMGHFTTLLLVVLVVSGAMVAMGAVPNASASPGQTTDTPTATAEENNTSTQTPTATPTATPTPNETPTATDSSSDDGDVIGPDDSDVVSTAEDAAQNQSDTPVSVNISFLNGMFGDSEVDSLAEDNKLQFGPNARLERSVWYANDTVELHIYAEKDLQVGVTDIVALQNEGSWEVDVYTLQKGLNILTIPVEPDPGIFEGLINPHQGYKLSFQEEGERGGETVYSPNQPLIESVTILTVGLGGFAGAMNIVLGSVFFVWARRRLANSRVIEIGGETIRHRDKAKALAGDTSRVTFRGRLKNWLIEYSPHILGVGGVYLFFAAIGWLPLPPIPDPALVVLLVMTATTITILPVFLSWLGKKIPEADNYFWSVVPEAEGGRPVRAWKTGDDLAQCIWNKLDGNVEKSIEGKTTHTTGHKFDPHDLEMGGIWRGMPEGGMPWDLMRTKQSVKDIYGTFTDIIDHLSDKHVRADTDELLRDKRSDYKLAQFDAEHELRNGENRTDEFRDKDYEELLDINMDEDVSKDESPPGEETNNLRHERMMAENDGDSPDDDDE